MSGDAPPPPPGDEYDVLAGRQAQRAGGIAHESGELHRIMVESVRDYAIFALDPRGFILSWNLGAERIKGYTADEIVGRHFSIFYPPEKVAERFPEHELEVAAQTGRFEDEGWRIRKDGTRFWANVVITALRGEDGAVVGYAKITRDLSERRSAELALRDSEQRFPPARSSASWRSRATTGSTRRRASACGRTARDSGRAS